MLDALITSKTRAKLLLIFFLNSNYSSYLRNLENEFGESSNAIRVELNRFENAGLLQSFFKGNRKYYHVNANHPLYSDIHNIILKYIGIDRIIENVAEKLGDLERVFLTGDFAKVNDNGIIDLILVGKGIDKSYLVKLVEKAEKFIRHKIRYLMLLPAEFIAQKAGWNNQEVLLLWEDEKGKKPGKIK